MLYFYILVILQIVVESFPVSSSGHMQLFSLYMQYFGVQLPEYITATWFEHLLHIPTLCVVALFFMRQWLPIVLHPWRYKHVIAAMFGIGFIADAITTCFFVLWKMIGIPWWALGVGFCITSCSLASLLRCPPVARRSSWYLVAGVLGIAQGCALLPGISRFAATYACARWCGLRASRAYALSWLIAFPLIVGGAVHGCVGLYLHGIPAELLHPVLGISILGASVAAWYGLCLMYHMACAHTFYRWWVYMIAPFFLWAYVVMERYCI